MAVPFVLEPSFAAVSGAASAGLPFVPSILAGELLVRLVPLFTMLAMSFSVTTVLDGSGSSGTERGIAWDETGAASVSPRDFGVAKIRT